MPAILTGIGWHMVGAASAASFYAPIEKVKKWSWETTWAVAGLFSWILLPTTVSMFLLPNYGAFYAAIDSGVLWKVALFGAMWGVGNVNYGLAMRHLGISLGIGVAIGVTIVSYAGHKKEVQMRGEPTEFNLKLGLMLAGLCGVFSSGMSFAIDAAKPMEAAALHLGVSPLYAALPSYVLIMGGGALVNMSYCFVRLAVVKSISLRRDMAETRGTLLKNASMAATGGIMWYLQFFFYAWGAANIPQRLGYVNWMLHMSGYVLCGGIVGLALGEWAGVGSRPVRLLWVGMIVIILAANLVGLGLAT